MAISSQDIRQRAISAYRAGKGTQSHIAALFGISRPTMERWLRAYRHEGRVAPLPRGHRPRAFTQAEQQRLDTLLASQPDVTLEQIREIMSKTCSLMAIHRAVVALGWRLKKRRYERVNKSEMT